MKRKLKSIYLFVKMKYEHWLIGQCEKTGLAWILKDNFTDQLQEYEHEIEKLESKIIDLEQEIDTLEQVLAFKEALIESLEKES